MEIEITCIFKRKDRNSNKIKLNKFVTRELRAGSIMLISLSFSVAAPSKE
jgi:hypothetical protein